MGGAKWAGAEAWADAGPIAQLVWRRAGGHRVVKGNVLGGGVSTGAEWYESWEAAKLLHADGVFFSGVAGVRVALGLGRRWTWRIGSMRGGSAWRVA